MIGPASQKSSKAKALLAIPLATPLLKDHLKTKFIQWYADQVSAQLASGKAITAVKIDMCMSIIKPKSASWITFAYDCIRYVPDVICNGFCKAGIVEALKGV